MRYQKWGNKGTKLICYSQQKSKPYLVKDPNCDQEKVWSDEIEDYIVKLLFNLKNKTKETQSDSLETSTLDVLNEQREEIEKKIKRLYNLYAESEDDILIDTINENKKKLANIKKRIENEITQHNILINRDELKNTIVTLEETWNFMSKHERQNIVRNVIDKVTITDDNIVVDLII